MAPSKKQQEFTMPDGIKSYEDWTAPKFLQGEIEDLDLERIKLEFFQRERDNLKYRKRVRSQAAQIEDLTDQVHAGENDEDDDDDDDGEKTPVAKQKKDSSKGEGQGPSLNEARLEIALEKGLTISQARRLQGTTREELEADAVVYMEEHGISTEGAGDDEGGDGGDADETPKPPSKAPKRQGTKSGSERNKGDDEPAFYDPEKLLEQV